MSWVSTRTGKSKRNVAPSLLVGYSVVLVGELRGEEGETRRFHPSHREVSTSRECRVEKKVIVSV